MSLDMIVVVDQVVVKRHPPLHTILKIVPPKLARRSCCYKLGWVTRITPGMDCSAEVAATSRPTLGDGKQRLQSLPALNCKNWESE